LNETDTSAAGDAPGLTARRFGGRDLMHGLRSKAEIRPSPKHAPEKR